MRKSLCLCLTFVLLITLIVPLNMQNYAVASGSLRTVGSVNIGQSSTVTINQMMALPTTDNQKIISFDATFTNNGTRDLSFIDYWFKVRTKNGSRFTVLQTNKELAKDTITAKTSESYNMYIKVPKAIKVSDLIIDIVQWDFSQPNYERTLGSVTVPSSYTYVTPINNSSLVKMASGEASLKVGNYNLSTFEDNQEATVTLEITNEGSRSITLPSYNYYLMTKDELFYQLKTGTTQETLVVQPKATEEIQLTGEIPTSVAGELTLVITTKVENLEIPTAFMTLPKESTADNSAIGVGQVYTVVLKSGAIQTYVDNIVKANNDMSIYFHMKNDGLSSVTIPSYTYALVNDAGLEYPLNIEGEKVEGAIDPQGTREVVLNTTLPSNIDAAGLKLALYETNESSNASKIIATYELPGQSYALSSYTYKNKNGTYDISLNGIQRLPKGDEDLLVADLTIDNKGNTSMPLINLKGYLLVDGLKIDVEKTKFQSLDNVINIQPGSSVNIMMYTNVPYTYQFTTMSIILQEQESESVTKTITEFRTGSSSIQMKSIPLTLGWDVGNIGKRAKIKALRTNTYADQFTKIKYTELEIENLEKRYTDIIDLVAYYKTAEDVYFPATITEVESNVMPNGKVLLAVWSQIPDDYASDNLDLVVGQQLAGSTDGSYIKAVKMLLPDEDVEVTKVNRMVVEPYTLELSNVVGTVLSEERKIKFDYTLSMNEYYAEIPEGHTIVIEITDKDDKLSFETELKFNDSTGLSLGSSTKELTHAFVNKLAQHGVYTMNVYDKYQGHKKLIASDTLSWDKVEYIK